MAAGGNFFFIKSGVNLILQAIHQVYYVQPQVFNLKFEVQQSIVCLYMISPHGAHNRFDPIKQSKQHIPLQDFTPSSYVDLASTIYSNMQV